MPAALNSVLADLGITRPFPIQAATLADSLAGRDVLGRGRTGSGKTYAFALPIAARLAASGTPRRPGRPRALILAPTRELASQIAATVTPLATAMGQRVLTVFGGVGAGPQIAGLRAGVDILVACPGRLADHIATGHASLAAVEITVLDEADHMADLGFLPIVGKLLSQTPSNGQRMLFSATLDGGVSVLVNRFLTNAVTHSVDSAESPVSTMTHHVLHVREDDRLPVLVELAAAPGRTVVFTRTKQRAKRLTRELVAAGVGAVELHGNLGQSARTRNLQAFSEGSAGTLVATDIAARGIHVDDVALVVHADPPVEHKAYLHRSGRTARAGAEGVVITLMTDGQVGDVRELTRKAAIKPTTTRLGPGDPMLARLAPGERVYVAPPAPTAASGNETGRDGADRRGSSNGSRGRGRRRGGPSSQRGTATTQPSRTATTDNRAGANRNTHGQAAQRSAAPATRTGGGAAAPATKTGGAAAFSATSRPRGGRTRSRG